MNISDNTYATIELTLINFVPQYFQQLIGGIFRNYLSELGAVVFDHADPFNDDVVNLPAAALVGEPVKERNLLAARGLQIALDFGAALFKHGFLIKDNFLIRIGQQPVRIDTLEQFFEKLDKFLLLLRLHFFPFPAQGPS